MENAFLYNRLLLVGTFNGNKRIFQHVKNIVEIVKKHLEREKD